MHLYVFKRSYQRQNVTDTKSCNASHIVINDVNTEEVMIIDDNSSEKAKLNELTNWKTNNVYEEIPYNNQKLKYGKWVCTMKETNDQQIPKARLVVKGFEEPTKDKKLKDSPTCSKDNLWVGL